MLPTYMKWTRTLILWWDLCVLHMRHTSWQYDWCITIYINKCGGWSIFRSFLPKHIWDIADEYFRPNSKADQCAAVSLWTREHFTGCYVHGAKGRWWHKQQETKKFFARLVCCYAVKSSKRKTGSSSGISQRLRYYNRSWVRWAACYRTLKRSLLILDSVTTVGFPSTHSYMLSSSSILQVP